jgi:hypothetical protein
MLRLFLSHKLGRECEHDSVLSWDVMNTTQRASVAHRVPEGMAPAAESGSLSRCQCTVIGQQLERSCFLNARTQDLPV